MEHFVVSAIKYRPVTFEDVVGQQAITRTLSNAIENNHLSHALLFTGPRGVGKTTCARILAKKINQAETDDPNEDFAFNIFELDAASNNSVEDIRNLNEQVRIPPQTGKYKVYIIDEVHMLSQSAFNAFLKTLEEPPPHAIFILATTEKHKIIPTILSRCQIFDFRRITTDDIKGHLAWIAEAEGIKAEDSALHIIARRADGALRDALSAFDRVVSFSDKEVTRQAVAESLNVLDYTSFLETTDLLLDNDIPGVLLLLDELLNKGFDAYHFITGLAAHFRELQMCRYPQTIDLLEVDKQAREKYAEQAKRADNNFLVQAIHLTTECELKYKNSINPRLLVELCLMQLASLTADGQTTAVPEKKKRIIPPGSQKSEVRSQEPITKSQEPRTKNQDLRTRNIEPRAENRKPETRIQKSESRSQEPEARNQKPETRSQNPGTRSQKPGTGNRKPETRNQKPETENPKTPPEARHVSEPTEKISAFSLKSITKKEQLQKKQQANGQKPEDLPQEPFSETDVQYAWQKYTEVLEHKGEHILVSHLKMVVPGLKDNNICVTYPSYTIKAEMEQAAHNLIRFIRNEVKNHTIGLKIDVNEQAEKKYAYTTREKFEKLRDKYPLMETMRKEFELDV